MNIVGITAIIILSCSMLFASDDETYALIDIVASKYKRPFTVFDFGAGDGSHSFKLAKEFSKATCVMIEDNNSESNIIGDELLDRCYQHKHLKNIIYLKKFLSTKELLRLSECEHFDVIIVGNVLHYFGKEWKQAFRALHQMGDHLIIENPPTQVNASIRSNHARRTIDRFLKNHKTPVLGTVSRKSSSQRSIVYHVSTGNYHTIQRANYLSQKKLPKDSHTINSTYRYKKLIKSKNGKTTTHDWIGGIHLFTFKILGGCFPDNTILKEALTTLFKK